MSFSIFIIMIINYVPLKLKITAFTIILLTILSKIYKLKPSRKVYLVDYACFLPKKSQQRSREESIALGKALLGTNVTNESIEFQTKILMASGIGDATYLSEAYLCKPQDLTIEGARREAEAAIYAVVDALLAKTKAKAEDVGVLVVNCSVFNPVPSLTSMIVNKFKLKDTVKSFNLSGMGCSASLAAIGLAEQLLQVHENTCAMIVSTEVISQSSYTGNDRNKQGVNCIFRVGGAAILLSNKSSDRSLSKYQLIHTIRTNTSSSNESYKCIHQEEDSQGLVGITINKDLIVEARKAIKEHIITVGYLILPTLDQLIFAVNRVIRNLGIGNLSPYTPDFKRVIDHLFPHVGAKLVIDVLERTIKLDAEAARMTLYRFGNTSSSSVWYELAYAEAKGAIKKNDRVWQFAFGSGFKCTSVIWHALKNSEQEKDNPWCEEIDAYPIKLGDFGKLPPMFKQQPN